MGRLAQFQSLARGGGWLLNQLGKFQTLYWLVGGGAVAVVSLYLATITTFVRIFAPLSYLFVVLIALLIFSMIFAASAWGWRRAKPALPQAPMPQAQITQDEIREIARQVVDGVKAEEAAEIEARPYDFAPVNRERRVSAATEYVLARASAQINRLLTKKLNAARKLLDDNPGGFDQTTMSHKFFNNALTDLGMTLSHAGCDHVGIQARATELQAQVAANQSYHTLSPGDPWPTWEKKRDWHNHLARLTAYREAIEKMTDGPAPNLLGVLADSKLLGG